ncbi:hypothetical protein [Reichenbachiella sp. MSK19-1]|uniref:hypothetical protein n=1 Tax=Reichenbachiella sp. MSK19-1 TaxID=1897631 RepID=UPI000E6C704B|nr:hypothetical protein [Reichenbachiella sp. MSK19-1]RJE74572.1 hypothetical protein BGP76_15625 [Reichenbachiella sp. MSK19-1]
MNLPLVHESSDDAQIRLLQQEIQSLKAVLDEVEGKTVSFEAMLRQRLGELLIEEQELTVLYKQQKLAKKEKRLAQKRKGKNYAAPQGLVRSENSKKEMLPVQHQEHKRLYREAMLQVHPDKYAMREDATDVATELTTQLIAIYQSGDLKELQAFHAFVMGGEVPVAAERIPVLKQPLSTLTLLRREKTRLEEQLDSAKDQHLYQIWISYTDPMAFVEELEAYYRDRIAKLRRRTRS